MPPLFGWEVALVALFFSGPSSMKDSGRCHLLRQVTAGGRSKETYTSAANYSYTSDRLRHSTCTYDNATDLGLQGTMIEGYAEQSVVACRSLAGIRMR